ncbi:MAG: efflux RND transporter periplasmic adaptor subunit [Dysgonomonas mossii]|uniref:efflux RND transporter periplasmic adaptor subunit n=1 Tax=Dysgonomonas mossii TaxID=163665 RepID=UPI00399451CF
MKTIYIISVALITIMLASCGNKNETDTSSQGQQTETVSQESGNGKEITFNSEQYRLAGIQTGKISMRNISGTIKLNGVVDVPPTGKVTISAPLGGYLRSAGFIPGQTVSKGQVVATLESKEFIDLQQAYLQSKSEYEFLQQEYDRQQQLRENDINALKTFQQVTSNLESTKAKVKGLEQTLSLAGIDAKSVKSDNIKRTANLYAPIGGYIKTSNIVQGNFVNPSDILLEIIDINTLFVNLNAFEQNISSLGKGQNVKFSMANENSYERSAAVSVIGKFASDDKTVPVACTVSEADKKGLLPGMYIKAWVETSSNSQPTVPNEAIVNYNNDDYIILESDGGSTGKRFDFVQISKGITQEGVTAISFPSSVDMENARVVVKNAYTILSALINLESE